MCSGPGVISAPLFLCTGGSVSDLDCGQEVTCIARGIYIFFSILPMTSPFLLSAPSVPIRDRKLQPDAWPAFAGRMKGKEARLTRLCISS